MSCTARGYEDSSRDTRRAARAAVRRWLSDCSPVSLWFSQEGLSDFRGLEEVKVVSEKPGAIIYIDDRGFRFRGPQDFKLYLNHENLREARPWNRPEQPAGEL